MNKMTTSDKISVALFWFAMAEAVMFLAISIYLTN